MRLTKRIVDAQNPTNEAYYKWDSELSGFGLKILPIENILVLFIMTHMYHGSSRKAPWLQMTYIDL